MSHEGTETILVVDDETPILALTTSMLRRYGYDIVSAHSGQEALHFLQVFEEVPVALAIIDIVMPVMDGLELSERIKELRPNLPMLFISAYPDNPELRPAKTRNLAYLAKPFTSLKLTAKIREMLDGRQLGASGGAGF